MLKSLFIFALILLTAQAGYPYAEEEGIINLGEPTWQLAIDEFPNGLLVDFYEPFCFPCRKLWPELVKANKHDPPETATRFAKVECHDEVKVCNARNVYTFPTLMLYRVGKDPIEYRGERQADAILEWLNQVVDHKLKTVDNEADLFKNYSTALLVSIQSAGVNNSAGALNDDIEIVLAGPSIKNKVGKDAAVLLTQSGGSVPIAESDGLSDIQAQVDNIFNQKTAVRNLNAKVYDVIQSDVNRNFVIFFRTSKFDANSDAVKAFDSAAKANTDSDWNFVYANVGNDLVGTTVGKLFGVTEKSEQTVGIIKKNKKVLQKYLLADGITSDSIQGLVEKVKAGQAKRYYMSAKGTNNKGSILELVSTKYAETVDDKDSSTLVMLYFPWCEWCIKLEPTWEALAYRVRGQQDLKIARIDVSQNDVPGFDASEYPVILFYPKGEGKEAVEYLKPRNMKSFKDFLIEKKALNEDTIEL